MNKIHVLVVNINNLGFTKDCVRDLLLQTSSFDLTVIDQNSSEEGTREYLKELENFANVIYNDTNMDLNRVWNNFYIENKNPYLCFLNNDVRIPRNFIKDNESVFEKEEKVGCVVHSTNHLKYQKTTDLKYVIPVKNYMQGWDFCIRREAYNLIPDTLRTFGGDDYLYVNLYRGGWKTAFILSSPIIHYKGQSYKDLQHPQSSDQKEYKKLNYEGISHCYEYSNLYPTFNKIIEQ